MDHVSEPAFARIGYLFWRITQGRTLILGVSEINGEWCIFRANPATGQRSEYTGDNLLDCVQALWEEMN